MTTYNNKHYNNKTRKIKLFKGGADENDIKNAAINKVIEAITPIDDLIKKAAIDKVNSEISSITGTGPTATGATVPSTGATGPTTGATGPTTGLALAGKSGKKVSILIDFYKKLLQNDKDYGKKFEDFNKFYEIINVNQNGIDMVESITGVEELFKIFKNELEYIRATDAEKETKKKALSSNREKTKEITIEYKNGDYTITGTSSAIGTPSAPGTPASALPSPPSLSIEDNIKNTAINVVKSSVESIIITGKIENDIQETAKNTLFDAIITKIAVDGTMNIESLVPDFKLEKLYDNITKLTKDINKNNDNIKIEKNEIEKYSTDLEKLKKIENNYNLQKPNGKLQQKNLAIKIAINNKKITDIQTKISKSNKKIIETLAKNTLIDNLLLPLNSEKEYYLKLLNRAYDILIKKFSSINEEKYNLYRNKDGDNKRYIENMKKIRNKIYKLTHRTLKKTSEATNVPITSETAITNAAIKAVNDAVKPKNKISSFIRNAFSWNKTKK